MKTNKEKYDYYLAIIDAEAQKYIATLFPDGLPDRVYSLGRLEVSSREVTEARVSHGFYKKDTPTRKDVESIKAFSEGAMAFDLNKVYIHMRELWRSGSYATSATKYADIHLPYLSFNRDELLPGLEENRAKYLIKEGDIACSYCGKAIPEKDAVPYTIIFQMNHRVERATNKYCSQECGVHDQMGREG